MFSEFKKFIVRGNMIDLAVAVVIGSAFGAIVSALVKDMVTPLIAAIGGQPNFDSLSFTLHGSKFLYGDFINAVISFVIIAAVIFFLVIQPINRLMTFSSRNKVAPESATKQCPECLSEVPKKATRCAFCTSTLKRA